MNNKIIKIAISGALGKMGKSLIKEIKNFKNLKLNSIFIKTKKNIKKKDFKILKKLKKNKTNIYTKINNTTDFDILIDFTNPKNTIKNLNFCYKNNKKIIIGTTGLSKDNYLNIKKKSKKISILHATNFSIGINLILNLLKTTTNKIGKKSDIEIIESHHREKIDSPSGTAITLGKCIAKNMKLNFHDIAVYNRNKSNYQRKKNEIGFSSIRAGKIIGKHSILFSTIGETITITHQAFNRKPFSQGALQGAIWIYNKKNGLFTINDVLKNDKF
ncbi:4-hydroxy-tetrahydrodipicolinate reductase [Buchnera aphidicola]|uniref:4-hydroxy-tetrahydrodipicolinate reductase n=1 Tax=Buchnera aphidicola TaxID=9 RepID=UPI0022381102|nr:4-hydroxy-tetrahydrodipicolinate reductase [Buchnera aphidicola]MCW5197642.1 4-hydroxy-tetrahydrodipicolinate reductase [Buchnera aphidicola (Chaitophorus viminalis)]